MSPSHPVLRSATEDAVLWTARMGAVTAEALSLRHQITVAQARGRLGRAAADGLLTRSRPVTDAPALYAATPSGLRRVGAASLGSCRVTATNAAHLAACAAVAAAMETRHGDHEVGGERELRRAEHGHRGPLASARLGRTPDGSSRLHRPDLILWPKDGVGARPVAVEVELTIKSPARLTDICRAWARCVLVAGVVYCAAPEVEGPLARAVARVRAQDRIVMVPLAAAISPWPWRPGRPGDQPSARADRASPRCGQTEPR